MIAWRELCLVTLHPSPAVCTPRHRSRGTARHCACAAGCQGLRKGGLRGFWQGQTPAQHGSPRPSSPPSQCLMLNLIALDAYVHCPMVCGGVCHLDTLGYGHKPVCVCKDRSPLPAPPISQGTKSPASRHPLNSSSLTAFALTRNRCVLFAALVPTQIKGCARCRRIARRLCA